MRRALLLAALCSCAGERQAAKASAWSAGGAAVGAIAGSFAPPVGPIVGAAIGGASGHMIGENAALRTGEIQGSGAADAEVARWRGEAIKQSGALAEFKRLAVDAGVLGVLLLALWFVWRNGPHIGELGFIRGILRGLAKTGG